MAGPGCSASSRPRTRIAPRQIGRLHLRDTGELLEELLIELEEKEWARQAVIEELRHLTAET